MVASQTAGQAKPKKNIGKHPATLRRHLRRNDIGPAPTPHRASCDRNPVETQTLRMRSPERGEEGEGETSGITAARHLFRSLRTLTQNHWATTSSPQCGYSSSRTKRRWLGRFVTQVTTKQFGEASVGIGRRFSWDEGKELYLSGEKEI